MSESTVTAILDAARRRLTDAPRERIGELQEGRRLLGIPRAARIAQRGTAWHLGVLLVIDDGVLATGDIVRSHEEVRRGFAAESQRRRAELSAAAARGGVPEGETVHIGWHPIDLAALDAASSPLAVRGGEALVRWSAAGGYQPLARYLEERIELLRHPPERA
ncbi:glutaminase [Microbacterium sp. CFBP 8790]|uniref:glutaminase n=1 Tax=unclassified Microbacterium TaxID=2609290 RepID=UPI00177D4179|nr:MULTISPECIES: glutaminase [unclassified Microbacterium]MBD8207294.1 glutaminase [Microbacterium sp. CFBP 8801]MBD8508652.1 glutaminase [Microbacterium sp. CFBP 8790]